MTDEHTLFLRPPGWLPVLVAGIVGCFYLGGKYIEASDHTPTVISVSGDGRIFARPDIAEVSFGVQTGRQPSAKIAMEKLRKDMDAVFASVKAVGIDEKDIRTEQFSLNPAYDWTDKGQIPRGFEANQSLRLKVRDLDKVASVLTAATNAGANQAGNVQFTIDKPEELQAEARKEAIDEARSKAHTLASSLGMRLGKLKGFHEGGGGWIQPMMMRAEAGMGGGGPDLPLPAGEQEVRVQVTMEYEVK